MTIEQVRRHKLSTLDMIVDEMRENGAPYQHTDNNIYHFQCKPNDMVNWGNLIDYYRNEGANDPGVEMMTQEDIRLTFTVAGAIQTMTQIRLYYGAIFRTKWLVRENMETITDVNVLNNFDVENQFNVTLNAVLSNI